MKKRTKSILLTGIAGCATMALVLLWLIFSDFSSSDKTQYVYLDADDTPDSVFTKLGTEAAWGRNVGMKLLCTLGNYQPKPGRYAVGPSINTLQLFRNLRNGSQAPVRLTIPMVRTQEQLAARLAKELNGDSAFWATAFRDTSLHKELGVTQETLTCLFIPDTYEVYWTVSPETLLKRMKKESTAFWTDERRKRIEEVGLSSPAEVITMASIVEQETANNEEKPMIAGMYLNRLHSDMKLQADPTVKFALKQFGLKRILHEHLTVDSPYNTYLYIGLPPGPICIPSRASIEAVLHPVQHNYIYMCAKEDFSGTHNFAKTYAEHLANARRYAEALDHRGIK